MNTTVNALDLTFRRKIIRAISHSKIPFSLQICDFLRTKEEKQELKESLDIVVNGMTTKTKFLSELKEKDSDFKYWFSAEKNALLPGSVLSAATAVIIFNDFHEIKRLPILLKEYAVTDELYKEILTVYIQMPLKLVEWGYMNCKGELLSEITDEDDAVIGHRLINCLTETVLKYSDKYKDFEKLRNELTALLAKSFKES